MSLGVGYDHIGDARDSLAAACRGSRQGSGAGQHPVGHIGCNSRCFIELLQGHTFRQRGVGSGIIHDHVYHAASRYLGAAASGHVGASRYAYQIQPRITLDVHTLFRQDQRILANDAFSGAVI